MRRTSTGIPHQNEQGRRDNEINGAEKEINCKNKERKQFEKTQRCPWTGVYEEWKRCK